jgi:transcriptional regulator with XRE-family HTH domain
LVHFLLLQYAILCDMCVLTIWEAKMTSDEFRQWRDQMNLSQQGAADALGISKGSVELYERGSRREDGRPVEIPKAVELACAALARGINRYNGPKSTVAPFRVVEIEFGPYGEMIGRRALGQPYPTMGEAGQEAERLAKRFSHASGYNNEHGYWWGRDPDPSRTYRYVVEAV